MICFMTLLSIEVFCASLFTPATKLATLFIHIIDVFRRNVVFMYDSIQFSKIIMYNREIE